MIIFKTRTILVFILSSFLLYNCNLNPTDNDNSGNNSGVQFSPPSWIQGTWKGDFDLERFDFSNDNVIWILNHPIYGETINDFEKQYKRKEIKQDIITDDEYKFTIIPEDLYFHFKKLSSTSIYYWTTVTVFTPDTLKKIN